jgi:pimeloyl-ACP methyl ester carboxylesterase
MKIKPNIPAGLPRLRAREDSVAGLRIYSRFQDRAGDGRIPVILVHGLSMSSLYLLPVARYLAAEYRVYAPDLPGYGRSDKSDRVMDMAQLADCLAGWMDVMQIERAVLVGNSLGCQVIANLAVQNPGRVAQIVLTGPTMDPRARSYMKLGLAGLNQLFLEPLSFWHVLLHDYLAHGLLATIQSLGYAFRDPVEDNLRRVQSPALVVRGTKDKFVSQEWAEEVTRLLPEGRLEVLPGAGHAVNYDSPAELYRCIREFLGEG